MLLHNKAHQPAFCGGYSKQPACLHEFCLIIMEAHCVADWERCLGGMGVLVLRACICTWVTYCCCGGAGSLCKFTTCSRQLLCQLLWHVY